MTFLFIVWVIIYFLLGKSNMFMPHHIYRCVVYWYRNTLYKKEAFQTLSKPGVSLAS